MINIFFVKFHFSSFLKSAKEMIKADIKNEKLLHAQESSYSEPT